MKLQTDDTGEFAFGGLGSDGAAPQRAHYGCSECTAEFSFDRTMLSIACPYCGATLPDNQSSPRPALPIDLTVPLEISLEYATEKLGQWLRTAPLAPGELRNPGRVRDLALVYVPTWVFTATVSSQWRAEAGLEKERDVKVDSVSSGGDVVHAKRRERFIEWSPVTGSLPPKQMTRWVPMTPGIAGFVQSTDDAATSLLGKALSSFDGAPIEHSSAVPTPAAVDVSSSDRDAAAAALEKAVRTIETEAALALIPGDVHREFELNCQVAIDSAALVHVPMYLLAVKVGANTCHFVLDGHRGQVKSDPKPLSRIKLGALITLAGFAIALAVILAGVGVSKVVSSPDAGVPPSPIDARVAEEPATFCGSARAEIPATVGTEAWQSYRCRDREEAADWSECLARKQYTRERDKGCPGKQRCCP